jgi:hypothetical protein
MKFENVGTFDGSFSFEGWNAATREMSAGRKARIAEAARLFVDVLGGRQDPIFIREAFRPSREVMFRALCEQYPGIYPAGMRETITTSDFTALSADVLDRLVYGRFMTQTHNWRQMVRVRPLRDFRQVSRRVIDGGDGRWSAVAENAAHEKQTITETPVTYAPSKYLSGSIPLSWEAVMNDDLGIFQDIPERITDGGTRTLEHFVTSLYIDANGPHASLYTVGNKNIINVSNGASATNPPFSAPGLMDAFTVMLKQVDSAGNPNAVGGRLILWHGPALHNAVMSVLNSREIRMTSVGGTSTQELIVANWIAAGITPLMNPWIPVVASSANGNTTWGLTVAPDGNTRPALEVGFIPGYDSPVLLQKAGNTLRGGSIAQEFGDFDTMEGREMKGLLVFGGARISGKATVASNGSGV